MGVGRPAEIIDHLLPVRPKSVSRTFSEIERRPRLAGTLALASRLEAVLSIPSRRLDRRELQGGGYTDITTRGAPERILPIQFALDGEEFLRRFSERELLYFHREEFRSRSRRSSSSCSIKACEPGGTCGSCFRARSWHWCGRPNAGGSRSSWPRPAPGASRSIRLRFDRQRSLRRSRRATFHRTLAKRSRRCWRRRAPGGGTWWC